MVTKRALLTYDDDRQRVILRAYPGELKINLSRFDSSEILPVLVLGSSLRVGDFLAFSCKIKENIHELRF
jgi:hypothetical protein